MDCCRNVSVSGEYHHQQEQVQVQVLSPPCSKLGSLTSTTTTHASFDDLFPAQNTEVDVSLEWLSIFVEDCFSSTGNCLPATAVPKTSVENGSTKTPKPSKPLLRNNKLQQTPPSLQKFVVPGKARSKRKRSPPASISKDKPLIFHPFTTWSSTHHNQLLNLPTSDSPLLHHHQAYWLADSQLIVPKKESTAPTPTTTTTTNNKVKDSDVQSKEEEVEEGVEKSFVEGNIGGQQPRRCTHCLAQRTPQWRAGPLGPKTLCNACGVRYKSGRLLPEYRPAKSPTFVSYLHSNSHKKVMEMRMALLPSVPK
ncbi:GATA transcription factor 2-like [Pistacia vera]|uniref:GATA transcription factor 2-like n=1 Tax=Pistacia vera TaxID=55513 RepID=UPI00126338F7|nr:GATA transcription factor 2-like [Pistacia vera]